MNNISLLNLPKGLNSIVLDTDAYNEADDQFAIIYALLSKQINVEAIYAAPFLNDRSISANDGMEKSFQEILKILDIMKCKDIPTFRGSQKFMEEDDIPVVSEAVQDLIKRARQKRQKPLYVVSIGCPVNIASALLLAPDIIDKIVVVWLGGNAHNWHSASEFNLKQDIFASKILFDSTVALVQLPCAGVCSHLSTTIYELNHYLRNSSDAGKYLLETVKKYSNQELSWEPEDKFGWSKIVWDLGAVAWCAHPAWFNSRIIPAPKLTDDLKLQQIAEHHLMREVYMVNRDKVFKDLFIMLQNCDNDE